MAKAHFRVVYEGDVDCGALDPAGVAKAFEAQERGDIAGYELSVWENIDPLQLVSVEVVQNDS